MLEFYRLRLSLMSVFLAGALLGCSPAATSSVNACLSKDRIPEFPLPDISGAPVLSPESPKINVSAGSVDANDGTVVRLSIPEGASSVTMMVRGSGENIVVASSMLSPSGKLVWDFMKDINFNKTGPDDDPYTLLLPSNTAVELEPGDWLVRFITDKPGGAQVEVEAFFKSGDTLGTLDLNLFFVGIEGLSAEEAKSDPSFGQILKNVETIFEGAGISFGEVNYIDIEGENAERFRVTTVHDGELGQLMTLSGGHPEGALNFFFVEDLEGEASGFSLLGVSGGVPGPPGINGTSKSGVAVNTTGFREDPKTLELVMAHEASHYLGLFHTTERNGRALDSDGITGGDPLCDTPSCPDLSDSNINQVLSSTECKNWDGMNLMFSLASSKSRSITPDQARILRNNYLIK